MFSHLLHSPLENSHPLHFFSEVPNLSYLTVKFLHIMFQFTSGLTAFILENLLLVWTLLPDGGIVLGYQMFIFLSIGTGQ